MTQYKLRFPLTNKRIVSQALINVSLTVSAIVQDAFLGTESSGELDAVLTVTSHTADRISDETGKTTCTVEFTTDKAVGSWEARATYETQTPGPGVGWVVGSGASLAAAATGTFDVTYDELTYGDRTYTISVYQLS